MTPGIVAALALGVAALAWLVAPLLRADAAEAERVGAAVSEERDLRSRRDMVLAALRDLEDDRDTGKIDDRDYAGLRAHLETEAIGLMKQIEALDRARSDRGPVSLPPEPESARGREA